MLNTLINIIFVRFVSGRRSPAKSALLAIIAAILFVAPAHAVPIRTLLNLQNISIFERTGGVSEFVFDVNGVAIQSRIAALGGGGFDFRGTSTEFYDAFYSNADGGVNNDGGFLTIETVFDTGGGGANITGVRLNFLDGSTEFANLLASFVAGGSGRNAGSEINAINGNLGSFTALGGTSDSLPRLRLTVGFESSASSNSQAVSEPGSMALFATALIGLAALRRGAGGILAPR